MKIVELIETLAKCLKDDPDNTEVMVSPTTYSDLILYNPDEDHDLNWEHIELKGEINE